MTPKARPDESDAGGLEPRAGDRPAGVATGRDAGPLRSDPDSGTELDFTGLVLNEVDYDQVSVDYTEFVEIYNGAATALPLDGFAVVFANATDEINRVPLSGVLPKGGYAIVASPMVKVSADAGVVLRFDMPAASNAMPNTSPVAVGLLDTEQGLLFDSVSFGGAVTGVAVVGVTDPLDFVEGTGASADSNALERSLGREPNGVDTDDNAADWSASKTPTPGARNVLTP